LQRKTTRSSDVFDGAASMPLRIGHAMQNLDWFAQSGHGGKGNRDGRYSDPEGNGSVTGEGKFLDETVGVAAFKGDYAGLSSGDSSLSPGCFWAPVP
jgi:hypothetical protein